MAAMGSDPIDCGPSMGSDPIAPIAPRYLTARSVVFRGSAVAPASPVQNDLVCLKDGMKRSQYILPSFGRNELSN